MSLRHLLVVLSFTLVGCRAAAGPESPTPAPMDDDDAVDDDDAIDDDDDDEEDRTDEIFENEMIVIDIQMSNDDWEALRFQRKTRHSAFGSTNCREVQVPNPYTWFPATVTVDGEEMEGVGVRKKGHLGSQSTEVPSLKLKFDEFNDGGRYLTIKRLALNNSKSDASYLRMCLTSQAFVDAGIPAPRCTHGFVTVNGNPQGVVVISEEVKRPYLARWFEDSEGSLFEGTATDWRDGFYGGLEQETNVGEEDLTAELDAVFDILDFGPDETLEADLDAYINMDAFYRFWVMESIVWHRDGYSGNANNYFMYAHPADDNRFHFLPWGADSTFRGDNRANAPDSVLASGKLTNRLYAYGPTRERYYEVQTDILANDWDPDGMIARADRAEVVLGRRLQPDLAAGFPGQISTVRDNIRNRKGVIEDVIADGLPDWGAGMRSSPCRTPLDTVQGEFTTSWGTLGNNFYASGSAVLAVAGTPVNTDRAGARAGNNNGLPRVQVRVETVEDLRYTFTFTFPENRWFQSYAFVGEHDLGLPPMGSSVVIHDISGGNAVNLGTYDVAEGTWVFDAIDRTNGAPVTGSFLAKMWIRP